MGLANTFKKLFPLKNQPVSAARLELESCLSANLADINRFKKYIEQYSNQLKSYDANGVSQETYEYRDTSESLKRFTYSLYEAEKMSKFLRENIPEDIEYRKEQALNFASSLQKIIPESSDLRFHGTPIYFAEEILKSGRISSSADRFDGYIKSTDGLNEISVSDISSLPRTVDWFLDISAYNRCLPCGCLFVLSGEGQTEEQKSASRMKSVDFTKDPDRLKAVITTPENQARVREWLGNRGLSPDLSYSFDAFVSEMKRCSVRQYDVKPSLSSQMQSAAARISSATVIPNSRVRGSGFEL